MKIQKETGGPAFPRPASITKEKGLHHGYIGMSLRDYYAGQFLTFTATSAAHQGVDVTPEDIARECFRFADAMVAESRG